VLSKISTLLATHGISILAVSTFDTDYILVKSTQFSTAETVLKNADLLADSQGSNTHSFDSQSRAKPILKWAGGKSASLPQLLTRFPSRFGRYIEPFFGGGAVFFALRPGVSAILNDANRELFNLYTVIRDQTHAFCEALDRLEIRYSESFFYQLRSKVPDSSVDQAARTVFLNKTGFNGLFRLNHRGEFNVPFGKRIRCPRLYERDNVQEVAARLRSAVFHNGDFEAVIDGAIADDFVYCDPPYEPLSRTSTFTHYTENGFDQAAQTRLAQACRRAVERGAFVAISNSSAPFILNLYQPSWRVERVPVKRAINSKGQGRGFVDEVLILSS
jgi:DNA adenine methylase